MMLQRIWQTLTIHLQRVRDVSADYGLWHGLLYSIRKIFYYLTCPTSYLYHALCAAPRTFVFQGKTYFCLSHNYNMTWRNERAIEVPIVWEIVRAHPGKRILEVGNVLSHYFPVSHDVVDKYEKAAGVAAEDIVDHRPAQPYDLIVSISTLEHVGWDERPREPAKILRAVENMKNCLAPGGKLVMTAPLGYNRELDRLVREQAIPFTKRHWLKRISRDNQWIESDWPDVRNARFDYPYPAANVLLIGIIEKEP